ncbi:MAG: hypothetical protein R3C01_10100 [Planctomycetaceae bacterium]
MGLAIEVGGFGDEDFLVEQLGQANQVLRELGLPEHVEAMDSADPELSRAEMDSFPYSFLHHLRRLYARCVASPEWKPTPTPDDEDPG